MTTTKNERHSQPPWPSWLAHRVVFVRDPQGRVCALRTFNAGAPVGLVLGAGIVRTQRDTPRSGAIEWTVHASTVRHAREATTALALIEYSLVMLKGLQKALIEALATVAVAPVRNRDLIEQEHSILSFLVAAFLLVDPLADPDLATLHHRNIIRHLRHMPDLHGRLHLPAPSAPAPGTPRSDSRTSPRALGGDD